MPFLFNKERIAGRIIFLCLALLILTVIGEQLLYVKVTNIEFVDRNLYTIITDRGPINILPEDILRIESSTSKSSFQGTVTEQNRIYTKKGFLMVSTIDNYAVNGRKLINEIGQLTVPIWERKDTNAQNIRSYLYAIGTPPQFIPIMKFMVEFQYLILTVGGLTLIVLVCPFRNQSSETYADTASVRGPDRLSEKEQIEEVGY